MVDDVQRHEGSLHDLPPELAGRVQAELQPGEKLVWVGQPRPDLFAGGSVILMVFGLFFVGFSLFWMAIPLAMGFLLAAGGAASEGPAAGLCGVPFFCFALFGIPFVVIGFFMLTAPVWQKKAARRCCYALTDRRAVVWVPGFGSQTTVRNFSPEGLGQIIRQENADGSGSLIFHEEIYYGRHGRHMDRHGFMHINNVRGVEKLLRDTLLGG